jgi:hypothetical protein
VKETGDALYWERPEQVMLDLEALVKHSRPGYFPITGREFGAPPMARCGGIPGEEEVHGDQSTSVRPARCT